MAESYRDKLKRRQQQAVADKGKTGLGRKSALDFSKTTKTINWFQPRTARGEKNIIDILPFLITQEWYRNLRTPSGRPIGLEPGCIDYALMLPLHSGVGPSNDVFLCLREAFGRECVVCDDMFEFYRQGEKDKASAVRPRWRCWYNVYDYDDDAKYIQLFESSYYNFEATSSLDPQRENLIDAYTLDDGGVLPFYDLEEGQTLVCKFKEKVLGKNKFAEISEIIFEKRDPYNEDILNDTFPLDTLAVVPTYEDVKSAYYGLDTGGKDHNGSDVPEGEQKATSRTRGRSRGATEPEAKEETQAPPSRTRGRGAKPDAPEFDKDGEWGQCPAGGNWGRDCNQLEACDGQEENSCTQEVFEQCLEAFNRISAQSAQADPPQEKQPDPAPESTRTRTRTRTTTDDAPPAQTGTTRRRRGK